ncbi:MAG TPA: hypothetical protein P5076_23670, partial [Myxococcota bacterium]|nr:hypothetical protein [Myxococcota bacterium]
AAAVGRNPDVSGCSYGYEFSGIPCSWFETSYPSGTPENTAADTNHDGRVTWKEAKVWQSNNGYGGQVPIVRCFWHHYTHGAKVLNAAAVEFAKERDIAIFVKRTDGQGGQTVVRRYAPVAPGQVVGLAHERSVRVIAAQGESRDELLAFLDERGIPGKQLSVHRFRERPDGLYAAVVVSREFLEDADAFRAALRERLGERALLDADLGAVSLIGAGINQSFRTLRRALGVLAEAGVEPSGLHTSSFRITALVPGPRVDEAVQRLHRAFIEAEGVPENAC